MKRKPVTVTQIRRALEDRIHVLLSRVEQFSGDPNPQIVELKHRASGELAALEDVCEMIADRRQKPACW